VWDARLEFIDILDKISSVQQEKSGVQMNQSCARLTSAMQQQLLAVPNICAKACNPAAKTFIFYLFFFFGDKTINTGKNLQRMTSVFSYTIHSTRPGKTDLFFVF